MQDSEKRLKKTLWQIPKRSLKNRKTARQELTIQEGLETMKADSCIDLDLGFAR